MSAIIGEYTKKAGGGLTAAGEVGKTVVEGAKGYATAGYGYVTGLLGSSNPEILKTENVAATVIPEAVVPETVAPAATIVETSVTEKAWAWVTGTTDNIQAKVVEAWTTTVAYTNETVVPNVTTAASAVGGAAVTAGAYAGKVGNIASNYIGASLMITAGGVIAFTLASRVSKEWAHNKLKAVAEAVGALGLAVGCFTVGGLAYQGKFTVSNAVGL